METFVSGVGLAILSGLTWIAYRHADAYQKMYTPLWLGLIMVMVIGGVYNIGLITAHGSLMKFTTESWASTRKAIDEVLFPWWLMWTLVAINIYLGFLAILPALGITKQAEPKKD